MDLRIKRKKIVILGLDGSGKTSFLPIIQNGSFLKLEPETGKESAILKFQNKRIDLVALTGKKEFRNLWIKEALSSDLIVFLVDAYDQDRFTKAKEELDRLAVILRHTPFIVLANKFDQHPGEPIEIIEKELNLTEDYDFEIIPISIKNGFGLVDAISKIYLKLMCSVIFKNKLNPETLTIFNKGGIPLTTQHGFYCDEDVLKGGLLVSIISLIREFFHSDLKRIGTEDHNIFINRSEHFIASLSLKNGTEIDNSETESIMRFILEKLESINPDLLSKNFNSVKINLELQKKLPLTLLNIKEAIKQKEIE